MTTKKLYIVSDMNVGKQALHPHSAAISVLRLFATSMATGEFANFFNHRDTADVKVKIDVEQNTLGRRELQLLGPVCESPDSVLRAHSMILWKSPKWKV